MKFEKAPGYYILHHAPTGVFYIGSTKDVRYRLQIHKTNLKRGVHHNEKLQEAFTSWEDMTFVISYVDNIYAAREGEFSLLKVFHGRLGCCNIATNPFSPAEGTGWLEAYHAERLAVANPVEKKKPKETRDKIAASLRGRVIPPEVAAKISASLNKRVSINGETYESVGLAAIALDLPYMKTCRRLRSTSEQYKDWYYVPK